MARKPKGASRGMRMGRDAAAIKVVARMFNLRFDALWQRYEKEQKRKGHTSSVESATFSPDS